MFLASSRYAAVATVTAKVGGREVTAIKLRGLPAVAGGARAVKDNDQLDVMASTAYADGTKFWHIADANTELRANDLLAPVGRIIALPES